MMPGPNKVTDLKQTGFKNFECILSITRSRKQRCVMANITNAKQIIRMMRLGKEWV